MQKEDGSIGHHSPVGAGGVPAATASTGVATVGEAMIPAFDYASCNRKHRKCVMLQRPRPGAAARPDAAAGRWPCHAAPQRAGFAALARQVLCSTSCAPGNSSSTREETACLGHGVPHRQPGLAFPRPLIKLKHEAVR